MDNTPPDPSETRPSDPDLKWTGWALEALRDTVAIDLRAKRTVERQAAIPAEPPPDVALMQSRLSRSIRLSIAMTERIRNDYLLRRDRRAASGELARRRQRRDQVAEAVVEAVALPAGTGRTAEDIAKDTERVRSTVWEKLVEDEILDEQIDTLSPDDFVQAVCRKIGYPPNLDWMPRGGGWGGGDAGGADDAGDAVSGRSVEPVGAGPGVGDPGAGWAGPPEAAGNGGLAARMPTPDSS
jgi:hypothetical protein